MAVNWIWLANGLGIVLILVLCVFILRKWRNLKSLQAAQQDIQNQQNSEYEALRGHLVQSMQVIAKSMLDDQVELSEGCIRIKVLMDNFDPDLHQLQKLRVFSLMYGQLEHMPTHEARQQADKKLIRKLDAERFRLERHHRDEIREAAKSLLLHLEGQFLH